MLVFGDETYNSFIARMYDAFQREKFIRDIPHDSTPYNIPSAKKFYFSYNDKRIFVCHPNLLFQEALVYLWKIAKETSNSKIESDVLFEKLYESERFNLLLKRNTLIKNADELREELVENSFLYFDDNESQYYFNLFRLIKDGEITGGILHSLTRHFQDFNKFHPKPNGDFPFEMSSFLVNLIICSVFGVIDGEPKKVNIPSNYTIRKKIPVDNKSFNVVLYWDEAKSLFFLNSAYISSR